MNTNKLLIGGLLGGLAYFLLGWLVYGLVIGDMLNSMMPNAASVMRSDADMDIVAIIIGNLMTGFALSYIFEKWAGIRTLMGGIVGGAVVGFLFYFGFDCVFHGTTTLATWSGIIVDSIAYGIMSGLAGGIIGWWLGYNRK